MIVPRKLGYSGKVAKFISGPRLYRPGRKQALCANTPAPRTHARACQQHKMALNPVDPMPKSREKSGSGRNGLFITIQTADSSRWRP